MTADRRSIADRLDLKVSEGPDVVQLSLKGALDVSNIQKVEDCLKEIERSQPVLIVLDLQGLTFIDSVGMRLILRTDVRARKQGRWVGVVKGPDEVHRLFRLTGLDERLKIIEDDRIVPSGAID